MNHISTRAIALFGIFAILTVFLNIFIVDPFTPVAASVEERIAFLSPAGEGGGAIVPASCPSYAHVAGECTPTFKGTTGNPSFCLSQGTQTVLLDSGQTLNLCWSCVNSVSSLGGGFSTGGAVSGSAQVAPTSDTTYILTCNLTQGGAAQATVVADVTTVDLNISASPSTIIRSGNSATITWNATNVNSCLVTGPDGFSASGLTGSKSTGSLTNTSVYTLDCQTPVGQHVYASVTVRVLPVFEEQ